MTEEWKNQRTNDVIDCDKTQEIANVGINKSIDSPREKTKHESSCTVFERGKTEGGSVDCDYINETDERTPRQLTSISDRAKTKPKYFHSSCEKIEGLERSKSSLWSVSTAASSIPSRNANAEQSDPYVKREKSHPGQHYMVKQKQSLEKNSTASHRGGTLGDVGSKDQSLAPSRSYLDEEIRAISALNGSRLSRNKRHDEYSAPIKARERRNSDSEEERDPASLHQYLRINFEDVVLEPTGFHTPSFPWNLSKEIYEFAKRFSYSVISLVCAIPCAFVWGVWFSIVACLNIWCLNPLKKSSAIYLICCKSFWALLVATLCDPVCRSFSLLLHNVRIKSENSLV